MNRRSILKSLLVPLVAPLAVFAGKSVEASPLPIKFTEPGIEGALPAYENFKQEALRLAALSDNVMIQYTTHTTWEPLELYENHYAQVQRVYPKTVITFEIIHKEK